jgi:signal transduction histidine kinase/ligand-binding sensor domain-containing protein
MEFTGQVSEKNLRVRGCSVTGHLALHFFLICALLFWEAGITAEAAASTNAPTYIMRVWQAENGLPQNKVTAVVQTRDGYLWVGTYSGLARFDGIRFTVFTDKNTPEMHSSQVSCLFEAPDGTLWIGCANGEVTTYKAGKFQTVEVRAAWIAGKISRITTDEIGDVWLLNDRGLLARIRDGLVLAPQAGVASKLLSFTRSADGTVWVARDGLLSMLKNGLIHVFPGDAGLTNSYVQGIGASRDGGLWVANDGHVRKWKDDKWIRDLGAAPWGLAPLTCLVETRNGSLLAGTSRSGFFVLFPDTGEKPINIDCLNGSQTDWIQWIVSLMEDREGNLWAGTGGNGLIELRPSCIQTISPPDRWYGRAVLTVCPGRDNKLWVGTDGAGLYRFQNGGWNNFGYTNGIGNSYVWSVAEDSAGNLWVGTWGAGLFVRDGDHFKVAPGTASISSPMPALLCGRDGSLWVGSTTGLLHYQNGKTRWFTEAAAKSLRDVRAIAEDTNGAVWFGMAVTGLACLENGRIQQFRKADGLSSDAIECLHFDEGGALWIGTFGGGLCRFQKGHFSVIDQEQGLPNSVIGDIEDDGNGFFWMSSHGGIIRASKVALNECADGITKRVSCLSFGVYDGLPTIECTEGLQPAGCKTPDGRLWFPTSKGLVVVNPNDVRINPVPPPMALEEILVDGETVTNTASPWRIPPGRNRFEFHYTGLSYVVPEKVRFQYWMEGLEKDWVDAGTKRAANYSFLPPGDYIFHVRACNNDGVWNEAGVSLAFTVLPHFWQTWWFRSLAGLMLVAVASGTMWYDMRRRMRLRLEKLERQQAVARERIRIAKDIHDDLGASLTYITMLSESANDEPIISPTNLARIHGTARELTRSMDEIVWAVNPKHDTVDSLAAYLTRFAHGFLSAASIRCRFDMPMRGEDWPLSAEMRHNIFLAFKETLHNVICHAAATEVCVSLKMDVKKIVLTVTDDGRGFAMAGKQADSPQKPDRIFQGEGLANIRRRLAEVRGECDIQSELGKGTTVKITVPVQA